MDLTNRTRREKTCPIRSECRAQSDQKFFKQLFANDWDELVITVNGQTGELESRLQTHANRSASASNR